MKPRHKQTRHLLFGAGHMSEGFCLVPETTMHKAKHNCRRSLNRQRTSCVSGRRRIASDAYVLAYLIFFAFFPAMASASKTVQEKDAAAFSQGEFGGTLAYGDRIYCENRWSALNGNIGPRSNSRAAYADKVILFGGRSSTSSMILHNTTYAFNPASGSWDEISVSTAPSKRISFAMADDGTGDIVLFGGYDGVNVFDDTWIFSGNDWSQVECSTHPSMRMGTASAKLSADKIILFGGKKGAVSYSDTWIFNITASSWTLLNPPVSPSARANHAMAPAGEGKVLLYGGESGSYLKDCWIYDGSSASWTEIDVSASNPGQRSGAAMVYDSGIERIILFGGEVETLGEYSYNKALWMFNPVSAAWTQLSALNADSGKPEGRRHHIFCHSPGYGNILFGGGTAETTFTNNKIFSDLKKYVINSSGTYTTKIYDTGVSVNPVEYKSFWRYFAGTGDIKYQIATSSDPAGLSYTGPTGENSYYNASPLTPEATRDGGRYFSVRFFLSCVPGNVSSFYLSELNMKYNHLPEDPVLYGKIMQNGDSIFQSSQNRAWFYWYNAIDPDDDEHSHSYEMRLSTSPDFAVYISSSGIPCQEGITYSYYHPDDFYPEGRYYWKVRASDDYGSSGFSDAWSFYVDTTAPSAVTDLTAEKILDSPGSVSLSWTATGDDGTTGDITGGQIRVQWKKWLPLTVWYTAGYTEKIISASVSPGERRSVIIDGLGDGASYYFVIALKDEVIDPNRNLGSISNNAFSWTQSPPEISSVTSPAQYDILSGTAGVSYSLSDADKPEDEMSVSVYLSTDSMISWHTIADAIAGGTTFFFFDTLAFPNSDFCNIRVTASDRAGLSGEKISDVFLIRNPNYPPSVEFTAPGENDNLTGEVWVSWDISDGNPTDTHLSSLSISTNSLNWISIAENISDTYVSFNSRLFKDGAYYLKIAVEDSPADPLTGEAIIQVSILNGNTKPEAFSLISPADGAVLNSEEISFTWNEAADSDGDAVRYVLYYSTHPDFAQSESAETSLTGHSATLANLNDYYWKVKAVDFRGLERESSEIFNFTVLRGSMTAVRTSPLNGAYIVNMTSVTFYFNNPVSAESAAEISVRESSQAVAVTSEITGAKNNVLVLRRNFSYPKDISVSIAGVKDTDGNTVYGETEFAWKNFMPANSFAVVDFPGDNLTVTVDSACFAEASFVDIARDYATGAAARENMEMSRAAKFTADYGWRVEAVGLAGNSLIPSKALRLTAGYTAAGDFSRIRADNIFALEYVSGQWTKMISALGAPPLRMQHFSMPSATADLQRRTPPQADETFQPAAAGPGGDISFFASSVGPYALAAVKEAASLAPPLINKPNPFSATTEIWANNPSNTPVTVVIFALTGEKVYERVYTAAEASPVVWDGRDLAGFKLPDGMYHLSVTASGKEHGKLLGIIK